MAAQKSASFGGVSLFGWRPFPRPGLTFLGRRAQPRSRMAAGHRGAARSVLDGGEHGGNLVRGGLIFPCRRRVSLGAAGSGTSVRAGFLLCRCRGCRSLLWPVCPCLDLDHMAEWMASDLSSLDLLAIQIDGIHIKEELLLVAAVGIDAQGSKHPLGAIEGATESAATVQALLDNLVGRGLDPSICRLFIVDGAKALTKAIRRTFGSHTPIQRCQVHKARNITERLPKAMQASVRRTLRQAWELDDADKAEKLIRNLARRLEHDAPGVRDSILEGLDEILTVNRLGLPAELRRSLACTNIIENMNGPVRRVCRNVKHWRDAAMALRWTGAAMLEAAKGFRRLKAHRQLPILKAALAAHGARHTIKPVLERQSAAA